MAVASTTASRTARPVIRTCIGCRRRAPAAELLRVVAVLDESGSVIRVDPRRTAPGRGAWVHPDRGCVQLAEKRRAFGRALRVPAPRDVVGVLDWVQRQHRADSPDDV